MLRSLALVSALDAAGVDHVVVGGVAVVLHGHVRTTVDLDIALELSSDNLRAALSVLQAAGLHPRLPVPAEQFADPEIRRAWVEERNLVAFTLVDPADALVEVDLLATTPVPFAELSAGAVTVDLGDGTRVRVASIDHLIEMKKHSGRPQDHADIDALTAIRTGGGHGAGA
ncbi:hypothetical protein GCM10022199_08180 [Marihabitans asiaticum]|uniref:Nucleotidyltransferase AbiEii toxin of type IV toxin-antitoxin system n=1 Tax=Marihabitans asiaticum TaxID=415218 RepID=A0A560WGZ9_9MICO|nr:hypothetical protein [Marihabitans asiaticum]TWD16848.1 hypothetical protein FB557_0391 [Marihabitans asiaticum]